MSNEIHKLYIFGNFRFESESMTLWRADNLIQLSPKALELLRLLIERQGSLISKQEILETIWAGTFVEEGVLTQNIYTLRQALGKNENGKQFIENIARRGYRLTEPVRVIEKQASPDEGKLISAQAPLQIVSEEIIDKDSAKLPTANSTFNSAKSIVSVGVGLILLLVFVFFGYWLLRPQIVSFFKSPIENVKFQKITDTGDIDFLTISPDGNFVSYTKGENIYLNDLQLDSELKLEIADKGNFGCLQFSNDSRFIYFTNANASNQLGQILQVSRYGGNTKIIAENVWGCFSFSPDNKQIAFHRAFPNENRNSIVIKNLETGAEREIISQNPSESFYWKTFPAWSPNGEKLALVVVTRLTLFVKLLVVDLPSENQSEVKTRNFRNLEQIVWAADGNSLFASGSLGEKFQIWKISYPGGEVQPITNDLSSYLGISISADGKKLLARQRIYFSNIWVGNLNDFQNLKQITFGNSHNDGLEGIAWLDNEKIIYSTNDKEKPISWNLRMVETRSNSQQQLTADSETENLDSTTSADGQFIYFTGMKGRTSHIWRIDKNGGNPTQLTFGENQTENYPQVSADGNWLYYIQKNPNYSAVYRKSLINDKTEKLTKEEHISPGGFLSLSNDGKFLAFRNISTKNDDETKNSQVVVVSTENLQDVKIFNFRSSDISISWSFDGKALEYINYSPDGAKIWRRSLIENSLPTLILEVPRENIFKFAWSKDGKNLALARGQLLRDAVLLTNFE